MDINLYKAHVNNVPLKYLIVKNASWILFIIDWAASCAK